MYGKANEQTVSACSPSRHTTRMIWPRRAGGLHDHDGVSRLLSDVIEPGPAGSACGCCGPRRKPFAPPWALGAGCDNGNNVDSTLDDVLPSSRSVLPILGVAATLSFREKVLFLLTNVGYFVVAAVIYAAQSIPVAPLAACATVLCSTSWFHATIIFLLGCVSTYWHGAQCQMASQLYCHSDELGGARLHTPLWLKRLVVTDILCSATTMGVGFVCFGASRTLEWLVLPLVVFVVGACAKRKRMYRVYAFAHGLWHFASAAAISQIVLNPTTPLSGDSRNSSS